MSSSEESSLEDLMAAGHTQINAVKIMFKLKSEAKKRQFARLQEFSSPSIDSEDPNMSSAMEELKDDANPTGKMMWNRAMKKLSKAGLVQKSVQAFLSNKKESVDPEQVLPNDFSESHILMVHTCTDGKPSTCL